MTCREKLKLDRPNKVNSCFYGGCSHCPHTYGYLPRPAECNTECFTCTECWDREIPGTEKVIEKAVSNIDIHALIDRCMEKKDSYVSIYFATDGSVSVSVYPLEEKNNE